ncbi:MAG: prefoldin subunit alpha [archaeon]|nr:prefoldin subunit alpha [archaeon]
MNDEEFRQAMQTLESYQQQLDNINRQVRLLQSTKDDCVRATRSMQALAEAKPGVDILIPVGASSFVNVTVSEKKSAVINIGNKISVEKDLNDAVAHIEKNIEEINVGLQKSLAALQEVQQYSQQLAKAVQAEYARRQQSAPSQ